MNNIDDSFQRLFRAASSARKQTPPPPSAALEGRVLAHWRGTEPEDEFAVLAGLFRRAVVFAALVMMLSAAWNYFENQSDAATMALASYAIKMQLPP